MDAPMVHDCVINLINKSEKYIIYNHNKSLQSPLYDFNHIIYFCHFCQFEMIPGVPNVIILLGDFFCSLQKVAQDSTAAVEQTLLTLC